MIKLCANLSKKFNDFLGAIGLVEKWSEWLKYHFMIVALIFIILM